MNVAETARLLKLIAKSFNNFSVSPEKIDWWTECLDGISFKKARDNLKEYLKENKFPPTIADIINKEQDDDMPSVNAYKKFERTKEDEENERKFEEHDKKVRGNSPLVQLYRKLYGKNSSTKH